MSSLSLWSMDKYKGAPSFYNTVKGYLDAGWEVYLFNIDFYEDVIKSGLRGLNHHKVNILFSNAYKIWKLGYFLKIINHYYLNNQFQKRATEILKSDEIKNDVVIYAMRYPL